MTGGRRRVLIVAAVIAGGPGVTGRRGGHPQLFNWSDYIPQDVLDDFEREFGVPSELRHVLQQRRDDGEAPGRHRVVRLGGPSDYMIEV